MPMTEGKKPKKEIDFIGIGAPKSGTTWFCKCLEEHPAISFTKTNRKEVFFFNQDDVWGDNSTGRMSYFDRGIDWYSDQFPEHDKELAIGEFSVSYLSDPIAYKRIYHYLPDVKLIALLRNPAEMLYSLYWYFYNGAVINLPDSFEKAIDKGIFLDKGFYYKGLKKYFDTFPKENILVLTFDELKANPLTTIQKTYKFLGVDSDFIPKNLKIKVNQAFTIKYKFIKDITHVTLVIINNLRFDWLRIKIFESRTLQKIYTAINKKPGKYPPMNSETRKKCIEIYREDISNLEKLLDRDLSSWKTAN